MPFQPRNQLHRLADRTKTHLLTSQLSERLNSFSRKRHSITYAQELIYALVDKAVAGDIDAIREVFNRVEGKSSQRLQTDGSPLTFARIERIIVEHISPEQLDSQPAAQIEHQLDSQESLKKHPLACHRQPASFQVCNL